MAQHNISTSCILLHNDKVLMLKEVQNGEVHWDIPAGGLDNGETIIQGVCREVKEETGIVITNPKLQRIFQFMHGDTSSFNYLFIYELNDEEASHIAIAEKDIEEYAFFSKDQIQSLIDSNETEHELAKYRLLEVFKEVSDLSSALIKV